jgi:8-oxo-dGTP diphosphatase
VPVLLVTAAALLDGAGRVLVQQRPPGKQHAGLWEFPGGKVEGGETPEAALVRELAEELAIAVVPADLSPLAFASEAGGARHLLLLLYTVRGWTGTPRALAASALRWMPVEELATLPMPPADVGLVRALAQAG